MWDGFFLTLLSTCVAHWSKTPSPDYPEVVGSSSAVGKSWVVISQVWICKEFVMTGHTLLLTKERIWVPDNMWACKLCTVEACMQGLTFAPDHQPVAG